MLKNSATNMAGYYSVVISDPSGSVTSSVASLLVVYRPSVLVQPTNQFVLAGSDVTFGVSASGTSPLSYQWYFNGLVLNGQTNVVLSLTNVAPSQAGNYSVIITNMFGSVTSRLVVLGIGSPPVISLQPTNQTVLAGKRVLLTAGVSGVGPLTFQWQLNGTNLPNNLIATIAGNGTAGFAATAALPPPERFISPTAWRLTALATCSLPTPANNRIRKVPTHDLRPPWPATGAAAFLREMATQRPMRESFSPEGATLDVCRQPVHR